MHFWFFLDGLRSANPDNIHIIFRKMLNDDQEHDDEEGKDQSKEKPDIYKLDIGSGR